MIIKSDNYLSGRIGHQTNKSNMWPWVLRHAPKTTTVISSWFRRRLSRLSPKFRQTFRLSPASANDNLASVSNKVTSNVAFLRDAQIFPLPDQTVAGVITTSKETALARDVRSRLTKLGRYRVALKILVPRPRIKQGNFDALLRM